MNSKTYAGRRATMALAGALAAAGMILALAISGGHDAHADTQHRHSAPATTGLTGKQVALHDAMRGLWEAHGAWTHMVIVSFAGNLPNLAATEQTLLRNQVDIGNAVKPYYGAAAGNKLTKLLKAHISGAVDLLVAAKSGDPVKLAHAKTAWYANGSQVADFLSAANPRNWPDRPMRAMMKKHLDQVVQQAGDELGGHYAASARDYGPYIDHILDMADGLTAGIIKQFPGRFR
jgi:hypothetical protein